MPRDYAKPQKAPNNRAKKNRPAPAPKKRADKAGRPAQRSSKTQPAPANRQTGGLSVRWILSLAAVGGFIGFILYLNTIDANHPEPNRPAPPERQSHTQPPAQPREQTEPNTSAQEQQGFRFYEMLPDSEVIPPEVEEYTPGPAQQQYSYLVQTGSFRSQNDAERQRAQIAFQGLRAKVSRIDLDSGSVWYRVNVGPFTSRSQMNAALDKLVSINIQPLVRKIPKEG